MLRHIVSPIHLTLTDPASPVEIIYAGTFHLADRKRRLEITDEMVDQMATNFTLLGDEDRININVNHNSAAPVMEEAKAVGWLQAVYAERHEVDGEERYSLFGVPRWTEGAAEAIKKEEFKFLSAEIRFNDTDTSTGEEVGCRLGGLALTNIPAIPHLAPVHLSQMNMAARIAFATETLKDQSLGEKIKEICTAFFHVFMSSNKEDYWPCEIFEDHIIVAVEGDDGEKLYQVDFSMIDEAYTFKSREKWIAVEQVYQPVAANVVAGTPDGGASNHAATSGTTQDATIMEESRLRELLGIGADASIEDAMAALQARPTPEELTEAKQEASALSLRITELEKGEKDLEATSTQVVALTQKAEAFEKQSADLAEQVRQLSDEKDTRETRDRISLAQSQGKTTPAELDAEDGYLRKLAQSQPDVFDTVMKIRPENKALFTEMGAQTGPEPVNLDTLFAAIELKQKDNPEMSREDARTLVFAERPELEKLTRREG